MPAIAVCLTDRIATGHPCDATAIIQGSLQSNVTIVGKPVAVLGDAIQVHTLLIAGECRPHGAVVNAGSSKVFIGGIPVARIGDSADLGAIISGSSNVFAGG
jgi:uncharacterized Zn-binding protein involved in type VI secretion